MANDQRQRKASQSVMKPEVKKIFDDLDEYLSFCVEYGYVFNEKHLYDKKSPWNEMQRAISGRRAVNNWELSARQYDKA